MTKPLLVTIESEAGPFALKTNPYWIKGDNRKLPFTGKQLAVKDVLVDNAPLGDNAALLTADKSLSDRDSDGLMEHSKEPESMWLSEKSVETLTFEFEREHELESIFVWNYNQPYFTEDGLKTADLQLWTDGKWKTVSENIEFSAAEGNDDYDTPAVITIDPVKTSKVRFANLQGFTEGKIGLSEVKFFQIRGPEAILLAPADQARIRTSSSVSLSWAPGRDAKEHVIHIGSAPDDLMNMGSVKTSEAIVNGLERGQTYYWRVDAVGSDGKTYPGSTCSFELTGGFVGHWTFDTAENGMTPNFEGKNAAELIGDPVIVQKGKFGGALSLAGTQEAKILPLNLESDSVTISGWVKATEKPSGVTGLMMSRGAGTVAGLNLLGSELRYHWEDGNWDWSSGLNLPLDQWTFIALAVEPHQATIYMDDGSGMQSATHKADHAAEEFYADLIIGNDIEQNESRYFTGLFDDVRVYSYSLRPEDVEAVCKNMPLPSAGELAVVGVERPEPQEALPVTQQPGEIEKPGKKNLLPVFAIVGLIAGVGLFSAFTKKNGSKN